MCYIDHFTSTIYDFGDLVEALNADGQAIILSDTDIIKFPKGLSKEKHTVGVPKIDQIVLVKFTKNKWKYNFIDECERAEFQTNSQHYCQVMPTTTENVLEKYRNK